MDGIILFILVSVVAFLLFCGIITAIKKTLNASQPVSSNSAQLLAEQEKRTKEIKARQEKLMQDNQQKLRDYRRKNWSIIKAL